MCAVVRGDFLVEQQARNVGSVQIWEKQGGALGCCCEIGALTGEGSSVILVANFVLPAGDSVQQCA